MGVHGLWRLIEPSGKPVPVESLENKVLAVDVSIWLHQAIKGFQDAKGAPALNAHLLGVFHRVCKLLYFKIKPVFVFDGGVPTLKRETIAKRNKLKSKNISEADKIQKQLLDTLVKHYAINKVLADQAKAAITSKKPKETDDLFKLPEIKQNQKEDSSEDEDSSGCETGSPTKNWNLHNIDTKSKQFKSLPADVRHEILTDLKETRKQSSWGRLHELPTQSDDFSGFQMKRLLKRQEVQLALEQAEKEIGGHALSLVELEEILKDQGVISKNTMGNRIASDENTRYLYIRDVKKALEKARKEDELKRNEENEEEKEELVESPSKADLELESDIQTAIALSLQEQPSSSGYKAKKNLSFLGDLDLDSSSEDELPATPKVSKLTSAQNYMMEYSGLNPNEIVRILSETEKSKPAKRKIDNLRSFTTDPPGEKRRKLCQSGVEENEKTEVKERKFSQNKLEEIPEEDLQIIEKETDVKALEEEKLEIETENQQKIPETAEVENENSIGKISESEDSDDFEEVKDELSEINPKQIIEIKIESEKFEEEDDLFADIFTKHPESDVGNLSHQLKPNKEKDAVIPKEETLPKTKPESSDHQTSLTKEQIRKEESLLRTEHKSYQTPPKEESLPKIEMKELEYKKEEHISSKEKPERSELLQEIIKKAESLRNEENTKKSSKISEDELKQIQHDLNKEHIELQNEQGLRERLGTNITDQMYKEAQDLLELFGLPYIIAPMEAEAQCAFLETASLTDGTITDDSDIWLFGGKTVYKNFFNQSKHVLEYRAEDIKHHFKLTREQMILLALLVGSDYTTGLQGVGPVTAMEILAAFPPSNTSTFTLSHNQLLIGLNEFKTWFTHGKSVARGKDSLRNKLKNITFTENFPSEKVVDAYLNPTVDSNEEKFTWSKPDVEGLAEFSRSKLGWNRSKTDGILKPVLKRMAETKYQSNLLNYFKIKHNLNAEEARKLMSARVKSAVERFGKDPEEIDENEDEPAKKKCKSNEKKPGEEVGGKPVKKKRNKTVETSLDDEFIETEDKTEKKKTGEHGGKGKKIGKKYGEETEVGETPIKKRRKKPVKMSLDDEFIEPDVLEAFIEKIEKETCEDVVKKTENELMEPKKSDEISQSPSDDVKKLQTKNVRKVAKKEQVEPSTSKNSIRVMKPENVKKPAKNIKKKSEVLDEEIVLLKRTEALSEKRVQEIESEAEKKIKAELEKRKIAKRNLHRTDIIPQKELEQKNLMRTRMRAIEIYRKSKIDPAMKKKGNLKAQTPKDDACLSESSDSDL